MKGNSRPKHEDANVRCPYYDSDDMSKPLVCCEGVIEKTYVLQMFSNRVAFLDHYEKICCNEYRRCRHYRAVNRMKYGEN